MLLPATIFDENLKEKPLSNQDWLNFNDTILEKLKIETNASEKIELLGLLGHSNKILKNFKASKDYSSQAISMAVLEHLPKKVIQNQIRLADNFRYQKNFEKSDCLFDQAKNLLNQCADS